MRTPPEGVAPIVIAVIAKIAVTAGIEIGDYGDSAFSYRCPRETFFAGGGVVMYHVNPNGSVTVAM